MLKKVIIFLILIFLYAASPMSADVSWAASPTISNIDLSNVTTIDSGNVCVKQGESFFIDAYISDADGFADVKWLNFAINARIGNAGHPNKTDPFYYEGKTTAGVWVPDPPTANYQCSSSDGSPYWNSCTSKYICINKDGTVKPSGISDENQLATACPNAMYAFNVNRVGKENNTTLVAGWGFKPLETLDTRPGLWAIDFAGNQTDGDTQNTTPGDWVWSDKWLVYPCDSTAPTSTIITPAAGSWATLNTSTTSTDRSTGLVVLDADNTGGSGLKTCEYRVLSNGIETKPWTVRPCNTSDGSSLTGISVGPGMNCRDEGTNKCTAEVRSTDKQNNTSAVASKTFNIDYTFPTLSFSRLPATPTTADSVTFTATASDILSGLGSIKIYIDPSGVGVGPLSPTKTCPSSPCTLSKTFTTAGTHTNYATTLDTVNSLTRTAAVFDPFIVADVLAGTTVTNTSTTDNKLTINLPNIAAGSAAQVLLTGTDVTETNINKTVIAVNNAVTNPKIDIEKSTTKPADVPTSAAGTIYNYLKFTTQNMTAADIKAAAIEFQVTKSWISSNSVDPTKIVLSRYTTQWDELPTSKISEDQNFVYFSAQSPGYSVFAITTQVTPTSAPPAGATATPTSTPILTSGSCGSGTAKATELVTTPDLIGLFPTSRGSCIIDPKAAFAPFKIPTFDDLKSLYFDQK